MHFIPVADGVYGGFDVHGPGRFIERSSAFLFAEKTGLQ